MIRCMLHFDIFVVTPRHFGGNTVCHHPLPSVTWASTFWYTRHFSTRHFSMFDILVPSPLWLQLVCHGVHGTYIINDDSTLPPHNPPKVLLPLPIKLWFELDVKYKLLVFRWCSPGSWTFVTLWCKNEQAFNFYLRTFWAQVIYLGSRIQIHLCSLQSFHY